MELKLIRKIFTENSTIGELYLNDEKVCYTLEDTDRGLTDSMTLQEIEHNKVYGKTAIPYGRYEVAITFSNNFKQLLPLLLKVKGYEGVRIHSGNTDADTLGCVLVGTAFSKDLITNSRVAFKGLFVNLQRAIKEGKVFLTITK